MCVCLYVFPVNLVTAVNSKREGRKEMKRASERKEGRGEETKSR